MNILFLNSMKPDEYGGGEKWMISAAKGLKEKGHHVIIAGRTQSLFIRKAQAGGIITQDIRIGGDFNPVGIFSIYRSLSKNNIDVLICNFNKDLRAGGIAARLAGTPLVLARHGLLLCEKKWKYRLPLQYLAHGIITNSQAVKEIYHSYHWFDEDFIKVIYNGVDPVTQPAAAALDTIYPGEQVILAAGRLTVQKGFNYLIEAAALLKKERQDFQVIIAGDGDQRPDLQQQIRDRKIADFVTLAGHVEDLTPLLYRCELLILSSIYEGMPNIILEAMAAGKAVIATDVHGVRELVIHNQTGLLVPPKDAQALMLSINNLLNNRLEREKFGSQARERVNQNFSMIKMIEDLDTHLNQMLNKRLSI